MSYDPSTAVTSLLRENEVNFKYTLVPCCQKFKEMLCTHEFNITLPKYDSSDRPLMFYINTSAPISGNRWHRIAFCPFCGKHTSELKTTG